MISTPAGDVDQEEAEEMRGSMVEDPCLVGLQTEVSGTEEAKGSPPCAPQGSGVQGEFNCRCISHIVQFLSM